MNFNSRKVAVTVVSVATGLVMLSAVLINGESANTTDKNSGKNHPAANYLAVEKISGDEMADISARKDILVGVNVSIEVKNINKSFKSKKTNQLSVLENINLTIDDGELVCLLGPSGCGKTTLLRLIAGLDQPTSGEIIANGEKVTKPSGDRAVIFQQYSLFPWLTVLQNVTFGLEMTKKGSKEENIAAAERYLTSVGLIDFKDNYPHELSGGMKQRVAIIRSLLNHSPILLMDEPFSALDMQNRHKLQSQLIGVWKRFENTIVFVTHDVDEAVYLADKIVILDKNPGRIANIIDVDIERPRKRDSEEFIALQETIVKDLDMGD